MKSVLISIRKEHNDKILRGGKQWDGRKTCPKNLLVRDILGDVVQRGERVTFYVYEPKAGGGCGKVRYKFVSNGAMKFSTEAVSWEYVATTLCVSEEWARKYFEKKGGGYLIHIGDPIKFDEPKELSKFYRNITCGNLFGIIFYNTEFITRPPQSWCYVEELKCK